MNGRVLQLLSVACFVAAASPAAEPQLQPGVTPIDVAATPTSVLPGAKVELQGTTLVIEGKNTVTVTIKPPAAVEQTLQAQADVKSGRYSVAFTPAAAGTYQVTVKSPDGKGSATTRFQVVGAGDALAQTTSALSKVESTARQALSTAVEIVQSLPPSPARGELLTRVKPLQEALNVLPAKLAQHEQALQHLQNATSSSAEVAEALKSSIEPLHEWSVAAEQETSKIAAQLEKSKAKGAVCDRIDLAVEALNAVSLTMNLVIGAEAAVAKTFLGIAKNLYYDKVIPGLISRTPAEGDADNLKFSLTEAQKVGAAAIEGTDDLLKAVPGLTLDAVTFASGKLFGSYCQKLEGPLDATFTARLFARGEPYLKYTIKLGGKLTLRHATTESAGEAAALAGHFEGNAKSFEILENAIVMHPQLAPNLRFRHVVHPPAAPYIEDLGLFARQLTPSYFRVPVEGTLVGERITLKFLPATADFSDRIKGIVVYAFLEQVTGMPQIVTLDVTLQKAEFILTRALREKPEFELKRDEKAKKTYIERTFTREHKDDAAGIEVQWTVTVSACDPGCL